MNIEELETIWNNLGKIKKSVSWRINKLSEIRGISLEQAKNLVKEMRTIHRKEAVMKRPLNIIKKIVVRPKNVIKQVIVKNVIRKSSKIKRPWMYPTDDMVKDNGVDHYIFVKLKVFFGSHKEAKIHLMEAMEKIKNDPYCYLTGDKIDLTHPKNYGLDHIIPKCEGGKNEIENMGLTTRWVNLCKSGLNYADFLEICKKVVDNSSNS